MNNTQRKTYSGLVKFQAIVEVLKGKSAGEVARLYGFHPTMFAKWRKLFEEKGPSVFQNPKEETHQKKIDELTRLLGKKEVEIELLKNFLGNLNSP